MNCIRFFSFNAIVVLTGWRAGKSLERTNLMYSHSDFPSREADKDMIIYTQNGAKLDDVK